MTSFAELLKQHGSDSIEHISTKPWSDYKESDYTVTQWHNACLIHQHDGPPTSKSQCKLPVKTPDGALNRNGVVAAAAALAGARGGVDATTEEKTKARTALIGYYNQLNMPLPPGLQHSDVGEFLAHFGRKGMKWGQHIFTRDRVVGPTKTKEPVSEDHAHVSSIASKAKSSGVSSLSNKDLQDAIKRMNLENDFARLSSGTKNKGATWTKKFLLNVGQQQAQQAANQIAAKQVAKFLAKAAVLG